MLAWKEEEEEEAREIKRGELFGRLASRAGLLRPLRMARKITMRRRLQSKREKKVEGLREHLQYSPPYYKYRILNNGHWLRLHCHDDTTVPSTKKP